MRLCDGVIYRDDATFEYTNIGVLLISSTDEHQQYYINLNKDLENYLFNTQNT